MTDNADDDVLAGLMRRALTDDDFNFVSIIAGDLVLDGRLYDITDEEKEVVIRVSHAS